MSVIRLPIFSTKKAEPIFAYFLPEDAARMESIANIIIEFRHLSNQNLSTSQKMSSAEPDSALFAKTWRALVLLPNNREPFMLATTSCQEMKMEWPKCMKFYWGIFHCGAISRISTFYLIKATHSSSMRIDVWPNMRNKQWQIRPWTVAKLSQFAGLMKIQILESVR